MNIIMASLEHSLAPIDLRERLSFTKAQAGEMDKRIAAFPEISGCVLISTCNRTELYVSSEETVNPGQLLCQASEAEYAPYQDAFVIQENEDAIGHLMAVAAGLRSRIWGEDQIISQVKGAVGIAREAGTTDPILETLFRSAISAGKEVRTKVHLTNVPTSAASMAVDLLERKLGDLTGKKAMVIGNGEMGRLAAALLHKAGANVSVTLRTYRHGETIVPPGCGVVPYDDRFLHMEEADLVISATTSPHYTITAENLQALACPPSTLVDLAIPRDIQPEAGKLEGISLYNVDDLGNFVENRVVPQEVTDILNTHLENFHRWVNFRECMNTLDGLKEALLQRLLVTPELQDAHSDMDLMELAVGKTVDLLISGLADKVTAEALSKCESKVRLHTTGKHA